MPSRAKMPTGAPFRRALSQTPTNEKNTIAAMMPAMTKGMRIISGMEFIRRNQG
jgi:hypothetical protein